MVFLTPGTDVVVPATLLNNMWNIIRQPTAITADQHRDLLNLMALLRSEAVVL